MITHQHRPLARSTRLAWVLCSGPSRRLLYLRSSVARVHTTPRPLIGLTLCSARPLFTVTDTFALRGRGTMLVSRRSGVRRYSRSRGSGRVAGSRTDELFAAVSLAWSFSRVRRQSDPAVGVVLADVVDGVPQGHNRTSGADEMVTKDETLTQRVLDQPSATPLRSGRSFPAPAASGRTPPAARPRSTGRHDDGGRVASR